ncbi:uncharacterized protein CTRU02_205379 [Colletotrichum truncatum]|uniref:Uncharacterized protein n=1 Tax=Colletotrichum truncatum TaxID=5467 RepID=A0ACC3Z3W7_COLTU|nr:uncharacterized protein CTRU02_04433 [Colletotrichum truncatum]KAF6795623.1 hypothetical protein CTRU02_04433 [Colletotrichum truncatum]
MSGLSLPHSAITGPGFVGADIRVNGAFPESVYAWLENLEPSRLIYCGTRRDKAPEKGPDPGLRFASTTLTSPTLATSPLSEAWG